MQVAQKHEARTENQPAQRQGKGSERAAPRGARIAQLEAMTAASPRLAAQGALAAQLAASPAMAEQGKRMDAISASPRMAIQNKLAGDGGGEAVQRVEEEEPMQGKFEAAQLVEEEEALQGKFDPAQLAAEEEEPMQGKFETAQLVEEEEPLQGKFEPAQLAAEEEEPLQGKFEPAQLAAEEEEALQGKFEPAQLAAEEEEALQGKFEPAQLAAEEEEPMQGKFEPAQLAAEEEEPMQGKFEPAQLAAEEEELLQGKFETAQLAEEEEPLQGKFEGAQLAAEEEEPLQGKFEPAQLAAEEEEPLQGKFEGAAVAQREEAAPKNDTGLPNQLKSGIESMSGMSMDHVKVHYNSAEPAQLNAHAFAQGSDIHVAPGQEKHVPHEAWHVVQQAQGRVQATTQMKTGTPVNDDVGLETEADVMGAKALSAGGEMANAQLKEAEASSRTAQLEGRGRSGSVSGSAPGPSAEPAPSAMVVEEMQDEMNEQGNITTASGLEVSPTATPEEKITLAQVGDGLATGVKNAGTVAGGVKDTAESITKVVNPLEKGSQLFESTNSVWGHFKDAAVGVVGALASPIVAMISAGLGMKTKWAQWNVFEETVMETKPDGKKGKKPDAQPDAVYALTKSPAGFMKHVKDMFMGVFNFTRNLLALIPGAQIVAGPMAVFSGIVSLMDSLYKAGKSIYQAIMGEKKDKHSNHLLDDAIKGDAKAATLVWKLRLPSIAGTGFSFLDQVQAKFNTLTPRSLAARVGLPIEAVTRVIDIMKPGSGGPASPEELITMLKVINGSPASKDAIRDEIKAAMTGYGK
jgi:hypothetical protein